MMSQGPWDGTPVLISVLTESSPDGYPCVGLGPLELPPEISLSTHRPLLAQGWTQTAGDAGLKAEVQTEGSVNTWP